MKKIADWIYNNPYKYWTSVLLILIITFTLELLLSSCGQVKNKSGQNQVTSFPSKEIQKVKEGDCELTDKQWRKYLQFVKDSLKIEAKTKQVEIRYEYKTIRDSFDFEKIIYKFDTKRFADSLKAIKQMYQDSLDAQVKLNKSDNSLKKTELKQETKRDKITKRTSNWWVWIIVGFVLRELLKWGWIVLINYLKLPIKNR